MDLHARHPFERAGKTGFTDKRTRRPSPEDLPWVSSVCASVEILGPGSTNDKNRNSRHTRTEI